MNGALVRRGEVIPTSGQSGVTVRTATVARGGKGRGDAGNCLYPTAVVLGGISITHQQ